MKAIVATTMLAVALASAALAAPASQWVDPQAPCFRWPAVDMDGDGVFDRIDHCVNTPKGCTVDEWGCHTDADGDGVCDGVDRCPDTPARTKVDANGCSDGQIQAAGMSSTPPKPAPRPEPVKTAGPTGAVERQLIQTGRIRLENVYFETESAHLLPESEETLREVGSTLEKFADVRIEVEGHSDTRGRAQYNMKLSQARAETVRAYLLEHFQIRSENYRAKGYGESRPETAERNDEELLRNRRVELRVLNPEVLPKDVR